MPRLGPLSNQKLGRNQYLLGELLGEGGFGDVYKAENLYKNRCLQAIKVLRADHLNNAKHRERFIREVEMLAQLNNDHIVSINDLIIESNRVYLVMPFIGGGTLKDVLAQREQLTLAETEHYLQQICAALDYLHRLRVVHLDLKPANLLYQDGTLLLADFGVAHLIEGGEVVGGTSRGLGTPPYMAPEHLNGHPQQRSDIYALGVILYQMLTGQIPFEDIGQTFMAPPPALRTKRPNLPTTLDVIITKALAKEPEARYAMAGDLLAAFKSVLLVPNLPSYNPPIDRTREVIYPPGYTPRPDLTLVDPNQQVVLNKSEPWYKRWFRARKGKRTVP